MNGLDRIYNILEVVPAKRTAVSFRLCASTISRGSMLTRYVFAVVHYYVANSRVLRTNKRGGILFYPNNILNIARRDICRSSNVKNFSPTLLNSTYTVRSTI